MYSDGPGYQHTNEQDIVDLVLDKEKEEEDEDGKEFEKTVQGTKVSAADALKGMDSFLSWYQTQTEATASSISNLLHLRDLAAEKRESSRRQLTINSFFFKGPSR